MNWIKLAAVSFLLIVIIISPFLPGPPIKLVNLLSGMAQSIGFFGLLLLPIGMIWLIVEMKKTRTMRQVLKSQPSFYLAISAIAIITAIYLLWVIGAFLHDGIVPAFLMLIPGSFILYRAIRATRKLKKDRVRTLNPAPYYLLIIPLVVLMTNTWLVPSVSEYSRNYAIRNCKRLIAAIEDYNNQYRQYPESLQKLEGLNRTRIPGPSIMGISNFRYNRINDHYSISFSQWLDLGAVEEIVLYDKNNLKDNLKGSLAEYNYGFDLCRVKGAFAIHNTSYENWQYYLVD